MATHPGRLTNGAPAGAGGRTMTASTGPASTGTASTGTASTVTATPPVVRVREMVRSFGDRKVLDALDLDIAAGEFVALLGRSGSGKSTLLRALAGLDYDVAGSGWVEVPGKVSVVFQDSRLLPWQRVLDNVVLGLTGADALDRGRESLAEVGLAGRERAWPNQLSGGEQQRVALARSLVRDPELLLADEPFGSLDALTRIRMHGLLRQLCDRHRPAVLLVTHDVDEAIVLADRVLVLDEGRLAVSVDVELDGPRNPSGAGFAELRTYLLSTLGIGEETP
jgi:sulfonate transport system ATP-binding protein